MPRSRRRTPLALALLALCVASAPSVADAKKSKGPPARAVKSDVKFVRCQVCEEVAKTLAREAAKLRGSKGAKLEESDVLEMVEKACDPETETGEWLLKHDLVEKGSALKMQFMGEDAFGKCGQECKTMQLACEKIVADRDTDVAEAVFVNGATFEGTFATDYLCRNDDEDALGACLAKPPKLPKDRPKGPAFEKVDKKDVDMQRMMKTMRDAGMGGMQMYGRDDMEDMMDDYNDDFDASAFEAAKTGSDVSRADADVDARASGSDEGAAPGVVEKLADAGASAWRGAKAWFGGAFGGGGSSGDDAAKTRTRADGSPTRARRSTTSAADDEFSADETFDAIETDAIDADAIETDASESDAIETDAIETDASESDARAEL
jgi:hypothetical protein